MKDKFKTINNLSNKINTKQIIFYVYDPFLDNNKILFEKKRVVAASGGEKVNCHYSSNLKSFKHVNFDLVYFGSSWQYLNNTKNIFDKMSDAHYAPLLHPGKAVVAASVLTTCQPQLSE